MLKVVISGDRNWTGPELEFKLTQLLTQMPRTPEGNWAVEIIHGACSGVDMTADKIAHKLGFVVHSAPADWKKYGRAAGPIRNKEMLDYGANAVYAFHKHIENSKGTQNMVRQAEERGIPVVLIQ